MVTVKFCEERVKVKGKILIRNKMKNVNGIIVIIVIIIHGFYYSQKIKRNMSRSVMCIQHHDERTNAHIHLRHSAYYVVGQVH